MNPETTAHRETTYPETTPEIIPQSPHRIGKIARLPAAIRQKLNERLEDNEPAPQLLE